jgi:hypothetical protein
MIPANATLADVIRIVNENFSPKKQAAEFARQLSDDLAGGGFNTRPTSFKTQGGQKGQIPKDTNDRLGQLLFMQKSIVRKKIKVSNPSDKDQYVIDDRVVSMVMTDRKTGATWVWQDKGAGQGGEAPGGSEETTNSG